MKRIPLTHGKFALVDDEDYKYLSQWKWYALCHKGTQNYYATRVENYKRIFMHRIVASTPNKFLCDHINHDTLDNRKENLRNVTNLQNQMNRRANKNTLLGIKNISLTPSNTYRVHVRLEGKTLFRKTFKLLQDALTARNSIQEKYHGEFNCKED